MTSPHPAGAFVSPDGVEIPMGKGVDSGIGRSSLLYNEYPFEVPILLDMSFLFNV